MNMRKILSGSVLRSRIGIPSTDQRYDDIVSDVVWCIFINSLNDRILDASEDREARLNRYIRSSRIEVSRQNKALEFKNEIVELVPPEPDATVHDILDVIQKRATPRQQMVFTMLAQGMTLTEIADHLGVAVGAVHAEKQQIQAVLRTELKLNIV